MKRRKMTVGALGLFMAIFVLFHGNAHAYIDPGTGSIILQAIVGGIFAAILFLKMFWRKIMDFVAGLLPGKKEPADDNDHQS